MNAQLCAPLSHGLVSSGQQSCIGSAADITGGPASGSVDAMPLAAGSSATATAIRTADMVRIQAILNHILNHNVAHLLENYQ